MKIQKVFKDGVFLRDIYPHATWFQIIKFRIGQFIGRIVRFVIYWLKLGATASVAVALGAFLFGNFTGATTLIVNANSEDTLSAKVEQMKDGLVTEIANDENKNMIPGVYDDNSKKSLAAKDKISYGCMQFKISTIEHYHSILKKGDISDLDSVYLALDCDKAKALAKEIIFGTDGGLWNWSVATQEMGARVTIIKQLSK